MTVSEVIERVEIDPSASRWCLDGFE